jgi:hypothetical protein
MVLMILLLGSITKMADIRSDRDTIFSGVMPSVLGRVNLLSLDILL